MAKAEKEIAPGVTQAALSAEAREIIERIAWEVVPQLAEVIIKEHVAELIKKNNA